MRARRRAESGQCRVHRPASHPFPPSRRWRPVVLCPCHAAAHVVRQTAEQQRSGGDDRHTARTTPQRQTQPKRSAEHAHRSTQQRQGARGPASEGNGPWFFSAAFAQSPAARRQNRLHNSEYKEEFSESTGAKTEKFSVRKGLSSALSRRSLDRSPHANSRSFKSVNCLLYVLLPRPFYGGLSLSAFCRCVGICLNCWKAIEKLPAPCVVDRNTDA